MGSRSLTRGGIQVPCIGIEEFWPVDHHRSPCSLILEASAMLLLVCSACVHRGLSLGFREGPNITSRGPVPALSSLACPYILQPPGTLLSLILIARKLGFSLNFIFSHYCAVLCDFGYLEGDKAAREKKERWATENKDYPHYLNSMVHFTGFSGQRERDIFGGRE